MVEFYHTCRNIKKEIKKTPEFLHIIMQTPSWPEQKIKKMKTNEHDFSAYIQK